MAFSGGSMNSKMNIVKTLFIVSVLGVFIGLSTVYAQEYTQNKKPMKYWTQEEYKQWEEWNHRIQLFKTSGPADRRFGTMDGNKITTLFYNYGSIGRPNTEPSIEWPSGSNNGYAYEFGPIIGAKVVDIYGDSVEIVSDALIDGGDRAPSGKVWGWQPLPQYLNTTASTPAMSNNPKSWPQTQNTSNPFYNPDYTSDDDKFLWPGVDTLGQVSADLEAYWVMDDRDNDEFEYYPFENDSSRRGLGLELTCRLMQFAATPAEDVIFYIIKIKNVSDKRLDKVAAGMFGDPHIGGAGDFGDDYAGFDEERNMVYSWDKEGSGNDFSLPWDELGWLGFKFLESPKDTAGNELGLTSMSAPIYATTEGTPALDDVMWQKLTPGQFTGIEQEKDNVFIFGTGYFSLDPGESQQFSIAVLLGKGKDDLDANSEIAQEIYDLNYKFTKAPDPPNVTAIPGDGEVTLYWDTSSEDSFDDFFQAYDFEGYKVYRSTDKGQTWGPVITNSYGFEVASKPLAQYEQDNDKQGLFPYDKDGYKFDLGSNSGLVHTFKDESVINGVTYYYAVTAYDSGYISKNVHPAESGKYKGKNMQTIMPAPRVAGYQDASVEFEHIEGISTAQVQVSVIDPLKINGTEFELTFDDSSSSNLLANITTAGGEKVVSDYSSLDGFPVIFNGLMASFTNEPTITPISSLTGWAASSSQFTIDSVELEVSLYPTGGIRLERDLEIRFSDTIEDTSQFNNKEVKFTVWNTTDNEQMDLYYIDNNNILDMGDKIVAMTKVNGTPKGTWQVEVKDNFNWQPTSGDVFEIKTAKPFRSTDKYVFYTESAQVDVKEARESLDDVAVVPNPYVVTSSFETPPLSVFSAGRGERRVFFINLPAQCTIRIYTTAGELIRTLEHNNSLLNGAEPWDLLTSEGLEVSYGIYVYHLDAGTFGEKVGKFAIIK